jgi:hypothetical protein
MEFILNLISSWLTKLADAFKVKNATAFFAIAGLLSAVLYTIDNGLMTGSIHEVMVTLPLIGKVAIFSTIKGALVFLLAIFGVHTTNTLQAINGTSTVPLSIAEPVLPEEPQAWEKGATYSKGVVVLQNDNLYRCKKMHNAALNNQPSVDEQQIFWAEV